MSLSAALRLMRLDKPIGILLLWYPTAWALWSANAGNPPFSLVILFLVGTVLMRSAGCILNDIADRHVDLHVQRTKLRPLTSGEISLFQATGLLALLLAAAAYLAVVFLPTTCFLWALIAVLITWIYPLCKRCISMPQTVLGIAFSMGIPMSYTASNAPFSKQGIILFLINFLWIVAYDTMYAMVDKEDDLKIGVHSTAILFGNYERHFIGFLLFFMHFLWLHWAFTTSVAVYFYTFWLLGGCILIYQINLIKTRIPSQCFKGFLISSYYGAVMWGALIISLKSNY